MKKNKFKLLRKGMLFDLIGMTTMFIPVVGPFLDLIWAPIAAKKMSEMYEGTSGKVASVLVFFEEILPFDFIPTFTLMWLYTFLLSSEKPQSVPQPIEVRVND